MPKPSNVIVVIAGPTASGKSRAALKLAKKINGEIICADSRTVYKDLSVGVAKPTLEERQKITHHMLDLVTLKDEFNVSQFKQQAQLAIEQIRKRGNIPIIVGGSGLYIDALIYDFSFNKPANNNLRSKLNNIPIHQLQQMIIDKNLTMPVNKLNKRHLIRAIETEGQTPTKRLKPGDVIYTAINIEKTELKQKIARRVELMYQAGFINELEKLLDKYPEDLVRGAGIGYGAGVDYLQKNITLEEAKSKFVKGDMALAKRQLTWLKRNPDIVWFGLLNKLEGYVLAQLSK